MSQTGAMLFFRRMGRRRERASAVLTSNKSFEEWDESLIDDIMAAALIDRPLHHCHIVNNRGNSRTRHHIRLWQVLHPPRFLEKPGYSEHIKISQKRPPRLEARHLLKWGFSAAFDTFLGGSLPLLMEEVRISRSYAGIDVN